MTINNIKIKFIIIGICCLAGIGTVLMCGSASGMGGGLVSSEEDNRISDVNYLDMPAAESNESGGWDILFYIIIFILIVAGGLISLRFGQNSKKY